MAVDGLDSSGNSVNHPIALEWEGTAHMDYTPTASATDMEVTPPDPTTISGPPAVAAVFATYELLEKILMPLSLHQLCAVRRVARSWQGIMKRSEPLREKLFDLAISAPMERRPGTEIHMPSTEPFLLNPLISARTMEYSREPKERYHSHVPSKNTPSLATGEIWHLGRWHDVALSVDLGCLKDLRLNPSDSRRQMLLTQPPITVIKLDAHWVCNDKSYSRFFLQNAEGIRWEDILRVSQARIDRYWREREDRVYVKSLWTRVELPTPAWNTIKTCDGKHGKDGRCECLRIFMGSE